MFETIINSLSLCSLCMIEAFWILVLYLKTMQTLIEHFSVDREQILLVVRTIVITLLWSILAEESCVVEKVKHIMCRLFYQIPAATLRQLSSLKAKLSNVTKGVLRMSHQSYTLNWKVVYCLKKIVHYRKWSALAVWVGKFRCESASDLITWSGFCNLGATAWVC